MAIDIFQLETRMNGWCPWDCQNWFNWAVDAGWIPEYLDAGKVSGENVTYLMADSTEEGGFSLPRSHPDGTIFGDRRNAIGAHQLHLYGSQTVEEFMPIAANVHEAARRLAANRVAIRKWFPTSGLVVPEGFTPQEYEDHLVLDSYNRGLAGEERAVLADPGHPDAPTAHGRYATDILARAGIMQQLLDAWTLEQTEQAVANADHTGVADGED